MSEARTPDHASEQSGLTTPRMQLQENAATVTVSAVDEADHDMAKEPFNPRDNTATTKIASVNAGSLQLPKSANLPKVSNVN